MVLITTDCNINESSFLLNTGGMVKRRDTVKEFLRTDFEGRVERFERIQKKNLGGQFRSLV